ncbi:MAG: hypothetical protein ACYDAZ_09185, partial [Thermoplasmataceae archaeon]
MPGKKQTQIAPVHTDPGQTDRLEEISEHLAVGQWYWVKDPSDEEPDAEWLGCVMKIGSNFVELRDVGDGNGGHCWSRVLLSNVFDVLRPEPDVRAVIQKIISQTEQEVRTHLAAANAILARLGVSEQRAIGQQTESSGRGLATLSGQSDVKAYEKALARAKDKDLPALFKQIKQANAKLAVWMTAETLPLKAAVK